MDEESLIRYLRKRTAHRFKRGWCCPDEMAFASYADGRLSLQEREKIEGHIADCDFCLGQLAFLARSRGMEIPSVPVAILARAEELAAAKTDFALSPSWARTVGVVTACLVVAAVVSLSVYLTRTPAPTSVAQPSPTEGIRRQAVPAKLRVVSPAADSVVLPGALEIRWEAVSGALDYELRVVTEEGDAVWSGRTEGNALKLPSDIRLESDRKYFVLIQANLPEGKTIKSGAIPFTIKSSN